MQEIDILFVWIFVITCVFDRLSLDILSRTRCDTLAAWLIVHSTLINVKGRMKRRITCYCSTVIFVFVTISHGACDHARDN